MIPDAAGSTPGTVVSEVQVVSSQGPIQDLDITLNIDHGNVGDLSLRLEGPDGTVVRLVDRRGGGDNFTNTVLDDEAAPPIAGGAAPFTGQFRPEDSLSNFDSKDANGVWRLIIDDRAQGNTGVLRNWSLVLNPATPQAISRPQWLDPRPTGVRDDHCRQRRPHRKSFHNPRYRPYEPG